MKKHFAHLGGDGELGLADGGPALKSVCSLDLPRKYLTSSPDVMASKAIRCVQNLSHFPKGHWFLAGHTGGDTVNPITLVGWAC